MSHSKAKHHHKKAGEALAKGDIPLAMHHTGHLLSALRHGDRPAPPAAPQSAAPVEAASPVAPASPFGGMRGRLSQMKPPV